MQQAIENLISEFLRAATPELSVVQAAVMKYDFLPVYFGWARILGLTPACEIVGWDPDDDSQAPSIVSDPYLRRVVLAQAASRHPQLAALTPPRSPHAVTCDQCQGTGRLHDERLVCECGGLGWVIPGEQRTEDW